MLAELQDKVWDAIVIGTGMGGGILGRRLAERGASVLYLERGPAGRRTEQNHLFAGEVDPVAREIRGCWPEPIKTRVDGRTSEFLGTLAACVGGTSVFYAATLERPEHHDFVAMPGRPHPSGGWPIDYAAMQPYFDDAERMLEVRGTADPLSNETAPLLEPPGLSASDQILMDRLRAARFNPYRIHVGMRYLPGCEECAGRKCPRDCKMDARSAGVEPALKTGRAALIDRCHVDALATSRIGSEHRISKVLATKGGEKLAFRARNVVLAAGGLGSPRLLLASANETWPDGLANGSGLVGRNLMFHLSELFAVWSDRKASRKGPSRTIAFRDFYFRDGQRFGIVQSMGIDANYGNVIQVLNERFDRTPLRSFRLLRELLRLPALAATRILGDAKIFVAILEDLPRPENRVELENGDPGKMIVTYDMPAELHERRTALRKGLRKALPGVAKLFLYDAPILNFAHPSGTLRFGTDPKSSVLDPTCRAHEVQNLYVADSSFMPTSTGVNPSLTIAANALRVADAITTGLSCGNAAEVAGSSL